MWVTLKYIMLTEISQTHTIQTHLQMESKGTGLIKNKMSKSWESGKREMSVRLLRSSGFWRSVEQCGDWSKGCSVTEQMTIVMHTYILTNSHTHMHTNTPPHRGTCEVVEVWLFEIISSVYACFTTLHYMPLIRFLLLILLQSS